MNQQPDLLVFSGAGLSAPSGIPTFRDADGLWHQHRIEDICDFNTWKHNTDLVHKFYNQRRIDLSSAVPNSGHAAVAAWQRTYGQRVSIITQNVDNLLEAAGCVNVCHLHGNLTQMQCTACAHEWPVGYSSWDPQQHRCPKCSSRRGVKPAVVFFNEHAPLYKDLYWAVKQLHRRSMVIVIGTTGIVIDVQGLFARTPAVKVLNNLEPLRSIDHTMFNHVFFESVTDAVPKLDALVQAHMNQP